MRASTQLLRFLFKPFLLRAMGNMSRMTGISGGGGLDVGIGSMGNSEVGGGSWGGASQQQQLGQDYVLSPSSHTSPSSDSSAQGDEICISSGGEHALEADTASYFTAVPCKYDYKLFVVHY